MAYKIGDVFTNKRESHYNPLKFESHETGGSRIEITEVTDTHITWKQKEVERVDHVVNFTPFIKRWKFELSHNNNNEPKTHMNKSIIEATCELMEVAFIAKEQGHDVFVEYAGHVNIVESRLYLGGWDQEKVFAAEGSGADYHSRVNLEGILAPTCPAAAIREAGASILEIIAEHESK